MKIHRLFLLGPLFCNSLLCIFTVSSLRVVAQDDDLNGRWQPRATAAGLEGRHVHTAIWSGQEMIVWGGEGFMKTFNTGGRYNSVTDNWSLTTTTNAPA